MTPKTLSSSGQVPAGSLLTELVTGKTLAEAGAWDVPRLVEALGGLPDDKLHCAALAITALERLVASAGGAARSSTSTGSTGI